MIIEVNQLSKSYRDKHVLNQVSFKLEGPSIVGFLGHNGAGKTTLLNILANLMPASAGEILFNGESIFDHPTKMNQICFISESDNFHNQLTIKEIMNINQLFYPNWDQGYADSMLELFRLTKKLKVKHLSKGMQSALGIIVGLASKAPVVIFDEPYIGLDAAGRSLFYELLLEEYTENPRLFIMSTHLIDEAAELFNDIIIIQDGKLVLHDTYNNVQQKLLRVKGKKPYVLDYIKDKKVLQKTTFLNEAQAIIEVNEAEAQLNEHVMVEPVKLQELMVALSKQYREERV